MNKHSDDSSGIGPEAETLTPSSEAAASAGLHDALDTALSRLLSRLASLQGHAVPVHRFAMRTVSAEGVPLSQLDLTQRAVEQWLAKFPDAIARAVDYPQAIDLPAIWVSADGDHVYLLRGELGANAFTVEDADGRTLQLSADDVASGQTVVLHVEGGTDEIDPDAPHSALDWFKYSIKRRKRVFIEGALATLSVNVIGLGTSLYTMQVYDRVVPNQGYSTLWVLTIGVFIAVLFELAMKQVRTRMVDLACKSIDEELSAVFFGQALAIRMDARPRTVGTFASQIRHFESVRNFMTSATLFVLADAPFALLFIGVIALIAGPVALVPLILIPIAVATGFAFRRPIAKVTETLVAESNRKNGVLIEAIDGIESVKAAGGEWKMLDQWRALSALISKKELSIRGYSALSANLTQTIQQFSYVGMVAAGAYAITQGSLTVGGLIACTIISGRALNPIAQIAGMVVQWQHAKVALKGLDAIMALPKERPADRRLLIPESCEGRLRMESVKFAYGDRNLVLSVDQLAIRSGERVGIIGSVGSGKSTLLKIISGLYQPIEGRVFLDDVDMTHLAPEFVREQIGYLPQDVRLFSGTLRENLALGLPSPSDEQILAAARLTGLDRVITNHPKGLSLEITEGGRGLSGGQRQLVGLTRLALAQPRVILLDEPTASMDGPLEAYVTQRLFEQMPKEHVLVVVTHKASLLRHFTRLMVVDRGRVVLDGPRDQVLAKLREATQPPARPAEGPAKVAAAGAGAKDVPPAVPNNPAS